MKSKLLSRTSPQTTADALCSNVHSMPRARHMSPARQSISNYQATPRPSPNGSTGPSMARNQVLVVRHRKALPRYLHPTLYLMFSSQTLEFQPYSMHSNLGRLSILLSIFTVALILLRLTARSPHNGADQELSRGPKIVVLRISKGAAGSTV